jgi:hypothetical protein
MRKNLILVRAGDDSLHAQWLLGREPREFDLCISYYGSVPDRYRAEADHYHVQYGPRWPAHHAICQQHWEWLCRYERIAFVCDDLTAPVENWNQLFRVCADHDLDLAQPAIEGPTNHIITQPQAGYLLHLTDLVEIMCPVFRVSILEQLRWTLAESRSGWGLSYVWNQRLPYPEFRQAIVDTVRVRHTRARFMRRSGTKAVSHRRRNWSASPPSSIS